MNGLMPAVSGTRGGMRYTVPITPKLDTSGVTGARFISSCIANVSAHLATQNEANRPVRKRIPNHPIVPVVTNGPSD